ncbi:CoA-binding protein [Spirosoma sp. HMF3257]|uniref:CoA-binding protein n=1 Tax=Spirosoma telluris TaxID=2183553 RepID=A0A327NH22_9BACT|nr:CoA-binding protein [Spirosoma telluris]RAI74612.1 CoA-binding protein [Spirosoma telluris]
MSTQVKKTLVVGATEKAGRYANLAAYRLLRHGHEIELLGLKEGQIEGNPIRTGEPVLEDIDTVTMYVGAQNQPKLYNYIKSLKPRRVIFNPGAENPEFEKQLQAEGIEPIEACTLVMLSIGTY